MNERYDRRSRDRAGPTAGVDYAAIFEAAPNPYAVIDRELRYAAVNAAYCRVIGQSPAHLIGASVVAQFGDPLERDVARQLRVVIEHVFAEGRPADLPALPYRPFPVVELPFGRTWRTWRASHLPLPDESGRVELVLQHEAPISRDPILQELVRAERTERVALEQAVHRETGRALTLIDLFGAIRSEVLSAASTLLIPADLAPGSGVSADRVAQLEGGARYLGNVVGVATDLIGIIVGRGPFDRQPVDLGSVAHDAAELARRAADAVTIDVTVEGPAVVSGDREQLSRMMHGLLSSAIAVAPPRARVVLQLAAHTDDVELAMQGVGVDLGAESLPHLFQPIHLFDSSIADGSVTGRLTQYIVEAHGGALMATSRGVVVRLPRVPA
jgi:signal transduction histidine kinase